MNPKFALDFWLRNGIFLIWSAIYLLLSRHNESNNWPFSSTDVALPLFVYAHLLRWTYQYQRSHYDRTMTTSLSKSEKPYTTHQRWLAFYQWKVRHNSPYYRMSAELGFFVIFSQYRSHRRAILRIRFGTKYQTIQTGSLAASISTMCKIDGLVCAHSL